VIIKLNKYELYFYQKDLGKKVMQVHCCLSEVASYKLTFYYDYCMSFSCEISMLGISHLPMTTPKNTISEPYKHLRFLRIAKAFMVW
jgi:hypothetical protein